MVNEPRMIWIGNLISMHTTSSNHSSPSKPKQKLHFLMKWSLWLVSAKVKNAQKSPSVAHHFSPYLPKPFLHIVWEICPRLKVSQSWKRSIKLIFHENLGEGLLWYVCRALCVTEPWPILTPGILWSKTQVARNKMFLGFLKFSSLVT